MSTVYGKPIVLGGGGTKNLPVQVQKVACAGGDGKLTVTWMPPAADYGPLAKSYRVVVKPTTPQSPTDGQYVDALPTATSAIITGLQNNTAYHARVYPKGQYGWQTSPDAVSQGTPSPASPILANNTWAQISEAAGAGLAQTLWRVGDTKDITLSTGEVLTLQIYGFNHDDLASGGKAALTFGLKNLMADNRQMNIEKTNVGGFTGSAMYAWLQGTLYNSLPADLRAAIKSVNKKTSAGNNSSTINTNAMKIFLFSEVECFGTTTYSYAGEGAQYPIFTDNTSRIKYKSNGGGASNWWDRSPRTSSPESFCNVASTGSTYNYNANSTANGVCFGFCI